MNKYYFKTNDAAMSNALEWLETAKTNPGSWWPEWADWLKSYAGDLEETKPWEALPFQGLYAAPGLYVLKKS